MDLHDSLTGHGEGAPQPPSVLRALNAVQARLDGPAVVHDDSHLRATARTLLGALDLSPDVALACVLRNQIGGSYAARHSVETAVIAALVARALHMRPAHLLSLTAAALALHATGRHDDSRDTPRTAAGNGWFTALLQDHSPDPLPDDTDIEAAAHLLRMADRYCAGISARNYRRSLLPDDALRRVLADSPDPVLTEAFEREIGHYPPGTLVRLASAETGIVVHRDGARPEILCLLDAQGIVLAVPQPRQVDGNGCSIAAALGEDDVALRVPMKGVWGPLASL
ncbi:hypothetical protein IP91_00503 [Pseudoduganella lurida]|uniref:Metal-dependent phosphohydrolase n=1 Tax=Pseudoduganella lurida TaxID=1036180 RepID=A0A562RK51_9BURK|nr:hypothetical protein [Pseudoduganella lurida]TWI69435.1 hypothetical protein IP91_00503 [Pseudoduganella lurida]